MATPETTAMVQQMNRYFNLVKEKVGTTKLLLDTTFGDNNTTEWTWDLNLFAKNSSNYDFLTCGLALYYNAGIDTWSPISNYSGVIFRYSITTNGILKITRVDTTTTDIVPPYRLQVYWPVKKYIPDTSNAVTFDGEVNGTDFITMTDITNALGITEGTAINLDSPWIKFHDGETVKYVAKKPIRKAVSWNHLQLKNAVNGDRTLIIGGSKYKVRLFNGADTAITPIEAGFDTLATHGSEWNRLMYHVHSGTFSDPENTLASEGIVQGNLAQYTDNDLGMGYKYYDLTDTWRDIGSGPVVYKSGLSAVIGDYAYYHEGLGSVNFYRYHIPTGTWTKLADSDITKRYSSMAAANGKLYFFGASTYNYSLGYTGEYDPATDTWTSKNNNQLGYDRYSCATVDNKIYITGGETSTANFNTTRIYDPATDTWTFGASVPIYVVEHKSVGLAGKLYITSGFDNGGPDNSYPSRQWITDFYCYDPVANAWSKLADSTPARSNIGMAVANGKIYVLGGLTVNYNTSTVLKSYSPTEGWSSLKNMPYGIFNQSVIGYNNELISYGGYLNYSDNIPIANMLKYTIVDDYQFNPGCDSHCMENVNSQIIGRGKKGVSSIDMVVPSDTSETNGWRPVLELIPETEIVATYDGEILGSDLISMSDLTQAANITSGTAMNLDTSWLKFTVNGKPWYVAKKPIRNNISFNDLSSLGLVNKSKTININGSLYWVRVLKSSIENNLNTAPSGYDKYYTHGSEWNRLMYHVHSGTFSDPKNTLASEGIVQGNLAQFSDSDLGLGYPITTPGNYWDYTLSDGPSDYDVLAASVSVIGDYAYFIGGGNTAVGGQPLSTVYRYHIQTNTWLKLPNIPIVVSNHSTVAVNGKIYVFGGTTSPAIPGQSTSWSNKLYLYDPILNTWTTVSQHPENTGGISINTTVIYDGNDTLYFIGGNGGGLGISYRFYKYTISTNTWTRLVDLIQAGSPNATMYNGKIYTYLTTKLYRYDSDTNIWIPLASTTQSASGSEYSVSAVFGDKWYITSGSTFGQMYDFLTDSWAPIALNNITNTEGITGFGYNGVIYTYYRRSLDKYQAVSTINYPNGSGNISLPSVNIVNSVIRGLSGVSHSKVVSKDLKSTEFGWRPVLEYISTPNRIVTFDGEVDNTTFITPTSIIQNYGITGTPINASSPWLKFEVDAVPTYVSKKPILANISYSELFGKGLVTGGVQTSYGNDVYKVSLMSGLNEQYTGTVTPGFDTEQTRDSLWNDLMYRIHDGVFQNPLNTLQSEGIIQGDLAQYSDQDLGLYYSTVSGNVWQSESAGTTSLNSNLTKCSFVYNDKLYAFYAGSPLMGKYDLLTNTWYTESSPNLGANFTATTDDIKVYIFGGTDGYPGQATGVYFNYIRVYNMQTNTWENPILGPAIDVGYNGYDYGYSNIVYFNNKLYLFNGHSSVRGYSNKLYVYDFSTNAWTYGVDNPYPTERAIALRSENSIYVLGGIASAQGAPVFKKFDLLMNVWSPITTVCPIPVADMQTTSGKFAGLIVSNKMYVTAANKLYSYDLVADVWETLPVTPTNVLDLVSNNSHIEGIANYKQKVYMMDFNACLISYTPSYTEFTYYNELTSSVTSDNLAVVRGGQGISYVDTQLKTYEDNRSVYRPVLTKIGSYDNFQNGTWNKISVPTSLNSAYYGSQKVAVMGDDGFIYMAGPGVNNSILAYNPKTNEWKVVSQYYVSPTYYTNLQNNEIIYYKGKLYSIGGTLTRAIDGVSDINPGVMVSDPTSPTPYFNKIMNFNPPPANFFAYVQVGNIIYIHGGWAGTTSDNITNQLVKINLDNNTSTIISTTGPYRAGHGMAIIGNKLYITGGYYSYGYQSNETYSYDLTTNVWASVGTLDLPIYSTSGGRITQYKQFGNRIVYFGGSNSAHDYLRPYLLDVVNNTVIKGPQYSTDPLAGFLSHNMVVDNNTIYCIGGTDVLNNQNNGITTYHW